MWRYPSRYHGFVPATGATPIGVVQLRADAERNRLALIDAARAVFADQGLDAPLEEIASRAGVGIATLYRRFPTRQHLVVAALTERVAKYVAIAERALETADAWAGFAAFVEQACALQADDRGLSDLLFMALPGSDEVERLRQTAQIRTTELIENAKSNGGLRPDFVAEDLRLLLLGQAAIVRIMGREAPSAWRRYVALMLDAFRARERPPLPAAPSKAQMTRAMRRFAEERGCAGRPGSATTQEPDRSTVSRQVQV
jgi:AcrR family transcriptional regulator